MYSTEGMFGRFLHEPLFLIIIAGSALGGLLIWWSNRSAKR
jgi:hypothetical protein